VPIGIPKASKTILIFDLVRGLCYAFYPGVTSPFENILACLSLLEKETGIPVSAARSFYYDKGTVERITAVIGGYKPYLSKAELDTVKITAEGDLDLNDDWKIFEDSIKDNKKWLTIGYRRSTDNIMKYSNYIIKTEAVIFRYYRQKNLAMTILLREL
jgi:hypothetical protein